MKRTRAWRFLCVVVVLVGCDSADSSVRPPASAAVASVAASAPSAEPPPPPPSLRAEETVALYERLGAVFTAHADAKCPALVAEVERFADKNAGAFAQVRDQVVASLEKDQSRAERFHRAMEPIMTGSMRCKDESGLRAIVEKLARARAARNR